MKALSGLKNILPSIPFGFKLANLDSLKSQVGGGGRIFTAVNQPPGLALSVSDSSSSPPLTLSPAVLNGAGLVVWRAGLARSTKLPVNLYGLGEGGGEESIERGIWYRLHRFCIILFSN